MSRNDAHLSRLLVLFGPGLLVTAHLVTIIALLSFGVRAGGYPLHPIGVLAYGIATALSLFGLMIQSRQAEPVYPQSLFLVSMPALVSFLFWIGLGGTYAPYDPHDSDLVWFYYLLFSILFSSVAILYGSLIYWGIACITQVALYFCTYALPNYLSYPSAGLLEPQPSIFAALMGVYIAGALLLLLRSRMAGQQKPGLWLAAVLTSGIGGWFLHQMLTWLPVNGAYLGYIAANTYVPDQAWDWIRTAAEFAAAATIMVAALSGVLVLFQVLVSRRHRQLPGERAG